MNRLRVVLMRAMTWLLSSLAALLLCGAAHAASIDIAGFYGNYDTATKEPGRHALSLRGPKLEVWETPARAEKPFTIGVAFPHLKDSYWLAVNHGVVDEAAALGLRIVLKEAGGYDELETQQAQLLAFADQGVDGVILGSISYTGNDELVAQLAAQGLPVVEVVNDIHAGEIRAKALVSFYDMGYFAGEYVAADAEGNGAEAVRVLFLPGPRGSGWADDTLEGFQAATEFFLGEIDVVDVRWGDTGAEAQGALLREVLAAHPEVDYVVGNAVAASEAVAILQAQGLDAAIVSTYITPPVFDHIRAGDIAASPADMTVAQGRIAVGMMLRLLQGEIPGKDFPFRAGPLIPIISTENVNEFSYEQLFGPRDFEPVFTVEP